MAPLSHKNALALAELADRRALRDAKLARMRTALLPVTLAAMTLRTAANEYFISAGDPTRPPSPSSKGGSARSMTRARSLVLEGDLRDIFNELEGMRTAYRGIEIHSGGRADENVLTFFNALEAAHKKLLQLIDDHLREVEQSVPYGNAFARIFTELMRAPIDVSSSWRSCEGTSPPGRSAQTRTAAGGVGGRLSLRSLAPTLFVDLGENGANGGWR